MKKNILKLWQEVAKNTRVIRKYMAAILLKISSKISRLQVIKLDVQDTFLNAKIDSMNNIDEL